MTSTLRWKPLRRVMCVAVAVIVAAGCSSTLDGHAVKDAHARPDPAANLNPGNYPTKPHPLGAAGSPAKGAMAEGRRLGENTLLPYQADEGVTRNGMQEGPFVVAHNLSNWLSDPIPSGIEGHNFIAGFMADATTAEPLGGGEIPNRELMNAVLRFATPEDAAAAVHDMGDKSAVLAPLLDGDPPRPTSPVEIPRHGDTTAVSYDTKFGHHIVLAFTAHGPFVLTQYAAGHDSVQAAAELVAKALDQQPALIDAFAPTPPDQLAALPLDPSGLMARTLPPAKDMTVAPGDYGPHAVLVFMDHPARSQKLFDEAGVDAAAVSKTNVYRAKDATGAKKVADDFAAEMRGNGWTDSKPVPGIPDSHCSTKPAFKMSVSYCVYSVDRYAVEAQGPQRGEVDQSAAAQYLMLTAP